MPGAAAPPSAEEVIVLATGGLGEDAGELGSEDDASVHGSATVPLSAGGDVRPLGCEPFVSPSCTELCVRLYFHPLSWS